MTVVISILGEVAAARGGAASSSARSSSARSWRYSPEPRPHVSLDTIIDTLWPDDPPASAAKVVQTYVSRLRKTLGQDAIDSRGGGYALAPPACDRRALRTARRKGRWWRRLRSGEAPRSQTWEACPRSRRRRRVWTRSVSACSNSVSTRTSRRVATPGDQRAAHTRQPAPDAGEACRPADVRVVLGPGNRRTRSSSTATLVDGSTRSASNRPTAQELEQQILAQKDAVASGKDAR